MPSATPSAGRALVALAVLTLVGTGAVLALWSPATGTSDADAPPLGANASERYAALDGVTATETTVVERGEDRRRTVARVSLRPGTEKRRVRIRDGAARRYDRRVSNGSVLWLYDREDATATRIPLSPDPNLTSRGARIERLFARLNVTDPDAPATAPLSPGVDPLPVVPHAGTAPAGVATAAPATARYGVSYNGTATVDGREAYVLRVGPRAGSGYERTLWLDADHFFPLQHRTAWDDDGERVTVTTTYSNVTFDPGLSPATFRFEPPANATVERLDAPETTTYRSVAALRAATDVAVPDPTVPATFEVAYASETTGEVRGVALRYVNATSTLSVAKYDFTYPPSGGDERVTVAGREAVLSLGATLSVSWNCSATGYRYTVRGSGVSRDRLLAVADSVGC